MPQDYTLQGGSHATLTCAANDLVTITYRGGRGRCSIKNDGPGKIWFSFNPAFPAILNNANNGVLWPGETFYDDRMRAGSGYGSRLTMRADVANTIVGLSF